MQFLITAIIYIHGNNKQKYCREKILKTQEQILTSQFFNYFQLKLKPDQKYFLFIFNIQFQRQKWQKLEWNTIQQMDRNPFGKKVPFVSSKSIIIFQSTISNNQTWAQSINELYKCEGDLRSRLQRILIVCKKHNAILKYCCTQYSNYLTAFFIYSAYFFFDIFLYVTCRKRAWPQAIFFMLSSVHDKHKICQISQITIGEIGEDRPSQPLLQILNQNIDNSFEKAMIFYLWLKIFILKIKNYSLDLRSKKILIFVLTMKLVFLFNSIYIWNTPSWYQYRGAQTFNSLTLCKETFLSLQLFLERTLGKRMCINSFSVCFMKDRCKTVLNFIVQLKK